MDSLVQPTIAFIAAHPGWAAAVMFATAFGESFVFLSLIFPGTALLIAAGTLISAGKLPYLPILGAAIAGAVLGDAVSFWIGRRFDDAILRIWPFTRHPHLLADGIRFFARHGGKSVFIGRFFGPVRAVVPLAAGIMRMPSGRFWLANASSALVWAPILLFFGDALGRLGERLFGAGNAIAAVFAGLILFGIAGLLWSLYRSARQKP